MATAATGLTALHRGFKPAMVVMALLAVASAWRRARREFAPAKPPHDLAPRMRWLLVALLCSLAGDVALMFEGFFVPGLLAFLLAHLAYIALLKKDAPWPSARRSTRLIAAVGIWMLLVLFFGGLPSSLRGPVAVYVLAIALMAALAWERAARLRDGPSKLVAAGAVLFMVSGVTLAIHRFVTPLPLSSAWVLGTYGAAQCLIVIGLLAQCAHVGAGACGGYSLNSAPSAFGGVTPRWR